MFKLKPTKIIWNTSSAMDAETFERAAYNLRDISYHSSLIIDIYSLWILHGT